MSQIQEDIKVFKEKIISVSLLIKQMEASNGIFGEISGDLKTTSTAIKKFLDEINIIKKRIDDLISDSNKNHGESFEKLSKFSEEAKVIIEQELNLIVEDVVNIRKDFEDFTDKHDTFHGQLFDELEEHFEKNDSKQTQWNDNLQNQVKIIESKILSQFDIVAKINEANKKINILLMVNVGLSVFIGILVIIIQLVR